MEALLGAPHDDGIVGDGVPVRRLPEHPPAGGEEAVLAVGVEQRVPR
jgi:hypothetical protein